MSYVNNVLLSFSILEREDDRMLEVNATLLDAHGQGFGNGWAGEWYGGHSCMEQPLWGAAFNYVGLEDVIAAVAGAKWEYPDEVQVLWCGQNDNLWSIHHLASSGRMGG